jgi:hypothetical protein
MIDETSNTYGRAILPVDYQLDENDVLCGRGNDCFNHIGNVRFREIISLTFPQYIAAQNKFEKSQILNQVVHYIRSTSNGAGFVSKDLDTNRYYRVNDKHAVSLINVGHRLIAFVQCYLLTHACVVCSAREIIASISRLVEWEI